MKKLSKNELKELRRDLIEDRDETLIDLLQDQEDGKPIRVIFKSNYIKLINSLLIDIELQLENYKIDEAS